MLYARFRSDRSPALAERSSRASSPEATSSTMSCVSDPTSGGSETQLVVAQAEECEAWQSVHSNAAMRCTARTAVRRFSCNTAAGRQPVVPHVERVQLRQLLRSAGGEVSWFSLRHSTRGPHSRPSPGGTRQAVALQVELRDDVTSTMFAGSTLMPLDPGRQLRAL